MSRKPIIVFTTDDFFTTDYTILYDQMRRRGWSWTAYVIGDRVGKENLRGAYGDWGQLERMAQNGVDIQCHTFTHPNLADLTPTQVAEEMNKNADRLMRRGFAKPEHLALPFGGWNQESLNEALKHRKTVRNTGNVASGWNTYEEVKQGFLKGMRADIKDANYFETVKEAIDNNKSNKGVLVLYHHEIMKAMTPDYKVMLGYLIKLHDYIEKQGVSVMTMSEAYDYVLETLASEI